MSDARLRELERRWKASGSEQDELAYLREALRSGALREEQLAVASFFGNRSAEAVLGYAPPAPEELSGWLGALTRQGSPVALRSGVAIAGLLQPFWEDYPLGGEPGRALAAAEAWLRCPCAKHRTLAQEAHESAALDLLRPDFTSGFRGGGRPPPLWANGPASLALAAARSASWCAWAAAKAPAWGNRLGGLVTTFVDSLPEASHAEVRRYVVACLLPWALGQGADPPSSSALRRDLGEGFQAEVEGGGRDPALRRVRILAQRVATETASCAHLLHAAAPPPQREGSSFHRALFVPTEGLTFCLVLEEAEGRAWLSVAAFTESLRGALLEFHLAPEERGPEPQLPSTWAQTRELASAEWTRLRLALRAPGALAPGGTDHDPAGVRDGLTLMAEVQLGEAEPRRFLTWSPGDVAQAGACAEYFVALTAGAYALHPEPRSRELLAAIGPRDPLSFLRDEA